MTGLPPDPGPEIGPHCMVHLVRYPDGRIDVSCLDCDGEIVGTAGCPHEALEVVGEHARRMA